MHRLLMASAAALGVAGAAPAAPILGGETTVEVTADLAALGLGGAPFGTASADGAVFTFPITGGRTGPSAALIEHEGSGVTLFALEDASVAATVGGFLIDTGGAVVGGDLIGGAEDLVLFEFGEVDDDGIDLEIGGALAGALTEVFGAPDLTGAVFGVADTAPDVAPIPVPAGLPLLAAGLGALAFAARRRKG